MEITSASTLICQNIQVTYRKIEDSKNIMYQKYWLPIFANVNWKYNMDPVFEVSVKSPDAESKWVSV